MNIFIKLCIRTHVITFFFQLPNFTTDIFFSKFLDWGFRPLKRKEGKNEKREKREEKSEEIEDTSRRGRKRRKTKKETYWFA